MYDIHIENQKARISPLANCQNLATYFFLAFQ